MPSEKDLKLKEHKTFYGDGQLWEQEFHRNGKLEGERKIWYGNGQIRERGFYRNGKREGECKSWYRNGQILDYGIYRDGQPTGEYRWWYENGKIKNHVFYWNWELVDSPFNTNKKNVFIQLKRRLRSHADLFNILLISDLARTL